MDSSKVGIYLNAKDAKVVRITSPYWIPEAPHWVLVTNEPNAGLVLIRQTIKDKKLMRDPAGVSWGSIPVRD
ncbi:MAG: hypothetical protein AAB303_05325 [Chloroflexota bacterium]